MSKIALMVDSASGISKEESESLKIHVVRMPVMVDNQEYIDEETITLEAFTQHMRSGAICKTSQPPLGKIIEMYEQLLKEYDEIIYLPMSSKLSGTYQTALQASKAYDGRVTVIDSLHIAYVNIGLCEQVLKMISQGMTTSEIKEIVERDASMWACLLPDDLIHLKNGGRISAMAAALGNLLKIVPILKVEDGAIDVYDKVRTKRKALLMSIDAITKVENPEEYIWYVLHADCDEEAQKLANSIAEIVQQEVRVHPLGTIVMAHTGPDTIALGRMKKII
ncbi:MAG: DegV family protein [Erysipelotrichaceae bacterium]